MPTFYQPEISSGHLLPEESRHAIKVLRLGPGAEIELTDGKGGFYHANITKPDPRQCEFKITQHEIISKRAFSIHLAIAPTKNSERMEWMVEKCVEVGIEKISFILSKTSERKSINMERIEKIVISAMKQSKQAWLPELVPMKPIDEFISQCTEKDKFIAHVDEQNLVYLKNQGTAAANAVVLVGPEGDFTKEELGVAILSGFLKVSLGPNRLRTETGGLSAVMILNLLNQT